MLVAQEKGIIWDHLKIDFACLVVLGRDLVRAKRASQKKAPWGIHWRHTSGA
jgi:hypothetical protein